MLVSADGGEGTAVASRLGETHLAGEDMDQFDVPDRAVGKQAGGGVGFDRDIKTRLRGRHAAKQILPIGAELDQADERVQAVGRQRQNALAKRASLRRGTKGVDEKVLDPRALQDDGHVFVPSLSVDRRENQPFA